MSASVNFEDSQSASSAPNRQHARRFIRPLMDALAAGLLFAAVATMLSSAPVTAGTNPAAFAGLERAAVPAATKAVSEPCPLPIVEIATTSSPFDANTVYRRTSTSAAWTLLGAAVSLLTALNLALFRHLRRVYAACERPRSGSSGQIGR